MADLKIGIGAQDQASPAFKGVASSVGEADKALRGLEQSGGSADRSLTKAVAIGTLAAEAFKMAAGAVVGFAKDSLTAYLEQEKADKQLSAALRQLGYDAGALTPILKDQAGAFQDALGVSDDMVQGLQALMVRYGVAPADIERTTQAVLDYASATGTDAHSATLQLLKGVENGGKSLSKMGIDIAETGDKATDLGLAVEAMGKKFGGSAKADAEGLGGQLREMDVQMGELKEGFGAFIASINANIPVLSGLVNALKTINYELFSADRQQDKDMQRRAKVFSDATDRVTDQAKRIAELQRKRDEGGWFAPSDQMMQSEEAKLERLKAAALTAQQEIDRASQKMTAAMGGGLPTTPALPGGGDPDKKGPKIEVSASSTSALESSFGFEHFIQNEKDRSARVTDSVHDTLMAAQIKMEQEGKQFETIANNIGMGFANAFGSALGQLGRGGTVDAGRIMLQAVASALAYAVSFVPVIGAFLQPIVQGLVGGLAGMAGATSNSSRGRVGRAHDGAWANHLPRFHNGGEVPAMLVPGERVLSTREVSRMGGAESVDRAARGMSGQGGIQVVIAHDAKSFQGRMGSDYGSAVMRTFRANRGELATLLRRNGVSD